jgi:hypothetical protein
MARNGRRNEIFVNELPEIVDIQLHLEETWINFKKHQKAKPNFEQKNNKEEEKDEPVCDSGETEPKSRQKEDENGAAAAANVKL